MFVASQSLGVGSVAFEANNEIGAVEVTTRPLLSACSKVVG